MSKKILLDINSPIFQEDLFALEKEEQRALLGILKKIKQLTWNELYKSKGIRWEVILSKHTSSGDRIYSLRFSKKYRATAYREKDYMVMIALHSDHDSTCS